MGTQDTRSRRDVLKGALKAGAYVAPAVIGVTVPLSRAAAVTAPATVTRASVAFAFTATPTPIPTLAAGATAAPTATTAPAATSAPTATAVSAAPTATIAPPTATAVPIPGGTLTGVVTSAASGHPVAGATVTVGTRSVTTDTNGQFEFTNVPVGTVTVQSSASRYAARTDTVIIAATGTTKMGTALVLTGTPGFTITATRGAQYTALDGYLSGPNTEAAQGSHAPAGRFVATYYARQPVSYAAYPETSGGGDYTPKTTTLSRTAGTGQFVPGTYHYWVLNNYSTPAFDVAGATVTVFRDGAQVAQFLAANAPGDPTLPIWQVLDITVAADGTATLTPVQQFRNGTYDTVI